MATVEGLEQLKARINALTPAVRDVMADAVAKGAQEMEAAAKLAAPVSEMEGHPGELRDSVHIVDGQTPLLKRVIADARDPKGEVYAGHVEFGHKTPKGNGHVPPAPFFYPTWRLLKKRIRSRITRSISTAVKQVANRG